MKYNVSSHHCHRIMHVKSHVDRFTAVINWCSSVELADNDQWICGCAFLCYINGININSHDMVHAYISIKHNHTVASYTYRKIMKCSTVTFCTSTWLHASQVGTMSNKVLLKSSSNHDNYITYSAHNASTQCTIWLRHSNWLHDNNYNNN